MSSTEERNEKWAIMSKVVVVAVVVIVFIGCLMSLVNSTLTSSPPLKTVYSQCEDKLPNDMTGKTISLAKNFDGFYYSIATKDDSEWMLCILDKIKIPNKDRFQIAQSGSKEAARLIDDYYVVADSGFDKAIFYKSNSAPLKVAEEACPAVYKTTTANSSWSRTDSYSLSDGGKTLSITKLENNGLGNTKVLNCIHQVVAMPSWLSDTINRTTSKDGQRTETWGNYSVRWDATASSGKEYIILQR